MTVRQPYHALAMNTYLHHALDLAGDLGRAIVGDTSDVVPTNKQANASEGNHDLAIGSYLSCEPPGPMRCKASSRIATKRPVASDLVFTATREPAGSTD